VHKLFLQESLANVSGHVT